MNVILEMYCHACHHHCKTAITIDCDGDIALDAPYLSKIKCLLDDRQATWESDDF